MAFEYLMMTRSGSKSRWLPQTAESDVDYRLFVFPEFMDGTVDIDSLSQIKRPEADYFVSRIDALLDVRRAAHLLTIPALDPANILDIQQDTLDHRFERFIHDHWIDIVDCYPEFTYNTGIRMITLNLERNTRRLDVLTYLIGVLTQRRTIESFSVAYRLNDQWTERYLGARFGDYVRSDIERWLDEIMDDSTRDFYRSLPRLPKTDVYEEFKDIINELILNYNGSTTDP